MDSDFHLSKFFAVLSTTAWCLLGVWIIPHQVYEFYRLKNDPPTMTMVMLKDGDKFKTKPPFFGANSAGAELLRLGTLCSAIFCILCVLKGW